mgnify:FL=1
MLTGKAQSDIMSLGIGGEKVIINMNTEVLPQETVTYSRSYYYTSYDGTAGGLAITKAPDGGTQCTMTFPGSTYSRALGVIGYYHISSTSERVFGENYACVPMRQYGKTNVSDDIYHTFGNRDVVGHNIPSDTSSVPYCIFYKW